MDTSAQIMLVAILLLFGVGMGIYFKKSNQGNQLEVILKQVDQSYHIIQSVTLGSGMNKRFVDAVILSPKGIFVVLYSSLRGQIHGSERSENVKQVLGKTGVAMPNPVVEAVKIEAIFHEQMGIEYAYLKPIVVFDRQTDIRYDEACTVPTIHMQDLTQVIKKYPDDLISDGDMVEIKKKFHID